MVTFPAGSSVPAPSRCSVWRLICPAGNNLEKAERTVPERQVLRPDPELLDSLDDDRLAQEFADGAVVQTLDTLRRFRDEILAGLDLADTAAMARIKQRWQLAEHPPEGDGQFDRPSLILTGRQDDSAGYVEQFALLPHYPRATYAVLDVAGHNLQIEQPALFDALTLEWLDRVAAESGREGRGRRRPQIIAPAERHTSRISPTAQNCTSALGFDSCRFVVSGWRTSSVRSIWSP